MANKDDRIRLMSEILNGIKVNTIFNRNRKYMIRI